MRFPSLPLAVSLVLGLAAVAHAEDASSESLRAVTHEDVWLMRRLGTPVPNPAGDRVIVSVMEPSYE